jgi:hypothetical protein
VTPFLTSTLDDDWSAPSSSQFTPGKEPPVLFYINLSSPITSLDTVSKRKFVPIGNRTLIIRPVARPVSSSNN